MNLLHTAHVPAGPGPFPTILAIHGWGASAHDLLGLAPILEAGQTLVICPEGPVEVPVGEGMVGHGWFPLAAGKEPDPAEFAEGAATLRAFVDAALAHYPADPKQVAILGFSQGGVMGYELFLAQPERFCGLAALSTWLPPEVAAAHPPGDAHQKRPVMVMHGSDDPMIPVARAHESRDQLLGYGVDLSFREHGMGHEIAAEALRDLLGWFHDKVFQRIQLL